MAKYHLSVITNILLIIKDTLSLYMFYVIIQDFSIELQSGNIHDFVQSN